MPSATRRVTTTNTNSRCRSSRGLAGRRPVPVVLGAGRPVPLRGAGRFPPPERVVFREAGVGRAPDREVGPPPRDGVPFRDGAGPREDDGVPPRGAGVRCVGPGCVP